MWEILQSIFEELETYKTGRRRTSDLREILKAIFYLNKTGYPWRYLPKKLVSGLARNSGHRGTWRRAPRGMRDTAERVSRATDDFDGGKLVKGRKRHIIEVGCASHGSAQRHDRWRLAAGSYLANPAAICRMRSTMATKPLRRVMLRCSSRPKRLKKACASKARMAPAGWPE
ncbi:transposase [Thiocapsa sp.]|uniref:transposase n=1 Tax=Thiocapsa sp. TaxID=2024551 RepID=UPI00345AE948